MWCVLLILPKDSEETRLSNKLHHPDSMGAMLEEAKERQAAGHLVCGVVVLEAVGLENEKLLQLEAALASPGGLSLPPSCLGGTNRRPIPLHRWIESQAMIQARREHLVSKVATEYGMTR